MDDDQPAKLEKAKSKTKFGMMMSGLGRSAGKGFSRAGKQMQKGMVKAKQTAVEKIAKVPVTEEDPEIVSALERLKTTKTELYAISDVVRNLYEARVNEATFMVQLADKLNSIKVTQNDPFGSYLQSMGSGLASLETVSSEHLVRMESELVVPLEKFRDNEVESVQKLKLKYYNGKTQYDIAAHRLTKAQDSQDAAKIQAAQTKKEIAYQQLSDLRNDLKYQVNNLEQKKQVGLLQNMEQYWSSYSSFAASQSNLLSKHHIEKGDYAPPSHIEVYQPPQQQIAIESPSPPQSNGFSPMDEQKDSLMDSFNGNTNQQNQPPPPAFTGGDMMNGMGGGMGGMPPPNESQDGGFEYYDEEVPQDNMTVGYDGNANQNQSQEVYNPFDD